ncbi:GGDEF domain-containing protein [Salinimonas sp. HHU 13199]|uniref:diguanylate cyclase n=1 Tax=Salinimonas profundi TaxID=2729140 RepID=A0ABR8LG47_9ALTE|nr:GGDEF domain-containing protein [Salinimonas profundi]MBD3584188.1 GGDEF domain-containing protein [Salinimonas profundi]
MTDNPELEHARLRRAVILGPVIIGVFMLADMSLLPPLLYGIYLENRLLYQLPVVALVVAGVFQKPVEPYLKLLFSLLLLWLSFTNFALIHRCWTQFQFAFPYEGTILYAFFCVFALRIPYKYTFFCCIFILSGFLFLLYSNAIYQERGPISAAFVAGGLFICVYARYRIDRTLQRMRSINSELKKLSTLDPLTNLNNRRALMQSSESLLALSARQKLSFSVLLLDLDDFKKFNDYFGHQKGDHAICLQADILRQIFRRQCDVIGRYGGEEFMVALSGMSEADIRQKCEEFSALWQHHAMMHAPDAAHPVMTCSVGVAFCENCIGEDLTSLIHHADQALYKVKTQAKGSHYITTLPEETAW